MLAWRPQREFDWRMMIEWQPASDDRAKEETIKFNQFSFIAICRILIITGNAESRQWITACFVNCLFLYSAQPFWNRNIADPDKNNKIISSWLDVINIFISLPSCCNNSVTCQSPAIIIEKLIESDYLFLNLALLGFFWWVREKVTISRPIHENCSKHGNKWTNRVLRLNRHSVRRNINAAAAALDLSEGQRTQKWVVAVE